MYDQGAKVGMGGNIGCAKENQRIEKNGEVITQLEIAGRLGERLHDSIQRLAVKIKDVVRNEPTCGPEEAKECSCSVSLAEAMRNNNRVTAGAIEGINSLIERCEL